MKLKLLFVLIALFTLSLVLHFNIDESQEEAPVYVEKILKYSWVVRNTTNKTIRGAVLKVYSPVEKASNQECKKLTASHFFKRLSDDDGNQILAFQIPDITPFSDEIIRVKAQLVQCNQPAKECLGPDHDYTTEAKYIESSHSSVAKKAEELKGSNNRETAEKIQRWIHENLDYSGYLKNERGALYALRNRTGDCTEYMDLFVAMCRAVKVPARCVAGYVSEGDCVVDPSEYHNWAQYYDGMSWQIADPQRGKSTIDQSDYIAMRIYGKHKTRPEGFERFEISDSGLRVKMNH